jgi:hypothetical protein
VLAITAVFAVSRAAAYALGVRFDDRLLHNAYQLLDVRLLRHDPFVSIYYLHSQPPLFNALTALVLQLPHGFVNTTLSLAWHAAGLATAVVTYATLVRLGVRTSVAVALVCVFIVSPEALLVEHWFFYSQIQMLFTALLLLGVARFATTRSTADGLLFSGSLAALVLLRSSFHPLLMVLLVVIVWRQLRIDLRRLAVVAAVPLLLVAAWSIKNVIVFDSWSNSTWVGMNLSYIAHAGTAPARCRELVADHSVSSLACVRAFSPPSAYTGAFPNPEHYGAAATDRLRKSTGQPNFNASLYIDVAKRYQRDAIDLLRDGGLGAVTRAELAAYTVWAEPGDDLLQLERVRAPISGYADWFDRLVLLRPVATGHHDPSRFAAGAGAFPWGNALGSISYTLLAVFALALYGGIAGWRRGRRGDGALLSVCTVALVVLVYSVVLGNALDFRENNRFRVEVAPVTLVLAGLGAELVLRRRGARHAALPVSVDAGGTTSR